MEIQLPLGHHNLHLSTHTGDVENQNCPKESDSLYHSDDFYREVFCRDYRIGKLRFHVGIWSGHRASSRLLTHEA